MGYIWLECTDSISGTKSLMVLMVFLWNVVTARCIYRVPPAFHFLHVIFNLLSNVSAPYGFDYHKRLLSWCSCFFLCTLLEHDYHKKQRQLHLLMFTSCYTLKKRQ